MTISISYETLDGSQRQVGRNDYILFFPSVHFNKLMLIKNPLMSGTALNVRDIVIRKSQSMTTKSFHCILNMRNWLPLYSFVAPEQVYK